MNKALIDTDDFWKLAATCHWPKRPRITPASHGGTAFLEAAAVIAGPRTLQPELEVCVILGEWISVIV
jgi:hypothetical protein